MLDAKFEYVDDIYGALGTIAQQHGLAFLTLAERVAHQSWWASGIIGNGGFQYFYEGATSSDIVAEAFRILGFEQAAEACMRSRNFFPNEVLATGYEATCDWFGHFTRAEVDSYFDDLNRAVWAIQDQLTDVLERYINCNLDQFVHLPQELRFRFRSCEESPQ